MKNVTLLLLFTLCVIIIHAQRISIQPSILDFRVGASATNSQVVRITNLSDKKMNFQAYLADWLRDSTGGHLYFRPDTLSRSCASWIQLSRDYIEVEPGTTEEVVVRLNTPADPQQLKQMKWAMLFIQSTDDKGDGEQQKKQMETQVKEIMRVGVHIYETPPGLFDRTIKALSFQQSQEKNTHELILKNTGDVMLQCKTYLELTDPATGKSFKLDQIEFPVFPDGIRRVKMQIPADIPKGKYSALAVIDIGEDAPLEGIEKIIEVI